MTIILGQVRGFSFHRHKVWYREVFEVADCDYGPEIEEFKMADPKWWLFKVKFTVFRSIGSKFGMGVFGVADSDSGLRIPKFKIADPK